MTWEKNGYPNSNMAFAFHSWFCHSSGRNRLTITCSHHHGSLPSGRFSVLRYHSTTARIYQISENFAACSFSTQRSRPSLHSRIKRFRCSHAMSCSNRSKPRKTGHSWRILLWQHTTTYYKTRQTNSDFYLNFYAGEAHTKVRGMQQI